MTILSRSATAVGTAVFALALTSPLASAATQRHPFLSRRSTPDRPMRWFHWNPADRSLQHRARRFGSTAVIGFESMRDLRSLRDHYGFEHVRRIPSLRAAEVSIDAGQLHALLVEGRDDPRMCYVSHECALLTLMIMAVGTD